MRNFASTLVKFSKIVPHSNNDLAPPHGALCYATDKTIDGNVEWLDVMCHFSQNFL